MDRRSFIRAGAAASCALAVPHVLNARDLGHPVAPTPFKMKFAPHFGMFTNHAGEDLIDQLNFMADQGFAALEDNNLRRRTPEEHDAIGKALARLNMEMGVFVCYSAREASLTTGKPEFVDDLVAQLTESVEVAKRVNATWMTLVPGHTEHRLDTGFQTANIIEALKRGAEVFEPHGLVMVIEPLNHFNHPDHFVRSVAHAYTICKGVGSPAVKVLDDLYHQQVSIGNLIANMDTAWEEIAYIQIGDVPGRKEPTTGEMHYKNIFKHIHDKGYTGILGMEHGVAGEGKEGELALIRAYREVDL